VPHESVFDELKARLRGKVAILAVGNRYRADDGAGPRLIDLLRERIPQDKRELLIDGGEKPENYLDLLKELRPDSLLIVDAAEFSGRGGEPRVIDKVEIDEFTFSTHKLPLSLLIQLIEMEVGITPVLLGIQPENLDFSEALSSSVLETLKAIAEFLAHFFSPSRQP